MEGVALGPYPLKLGKAPSSLQDAFNDALTREATCFPKTALWLGDLLDSQNSEALLFILHWSKSKETD
jgi:hypothetical protein